MNELNQKISNIKEECLDKVKKASSEQEIEDIRVHFLGRKGIIADLMQQLKEMSVEEKRTYGPLLNELKTILNEKIEEKFDALKKAKEEQEELKRKYFDVTAYKPQQLFGTLHPYTYVSKKIEDVFISMGYKIADGPELENDYYNFEALNIPADHPARDMQDTFWLTLPGKLMRTHTSSVQVHSMENQKPPLAILAPGRCYRHEATDASHDFVFMQVEGLLINKDISMSNLLATIKVAFQAIFEKEDLDIRLRPGYFPFVEPGVEVDMRCPFCQTGCSVCKKTRWIEMGGAGLVHPNVLKCSGIDPKEYSGFAFGFGLTRLVMLKYGITDIRLLSTGKLDFLNKF